MERAAVTLAKEVGYINAGTVEYLFTAGGGGGEEEAAFFFLELNPRLQVCGIGRVGLLASHKRTHAHMHARVHAWLTYIYLQDRPLTLLHIPPAHTHTHQTHSTANHTSYMYINDQLNERAEHPVTEMITCPPPLPYSAPTHGHK